MKELICPNCGKPIQIDESMYAALIDQVRNAEFDQAIARRVTEMKEKQAAEQKAAQAQMELKVQEKNSEIDSLKARIQAFEERKKLELDLALSAKEREVAAQLSAKDNKIAELKSQAELERKEAELKEKSINERHAGEMKAMEEQVAFYKDFKARKSTKDIGESLEQYCYKLYNQNLRPVMQDAYFDKDNDSSEGSKGDFIFRDSEDGVEYISIEFEMKNEADDTEKKHRNSDFFKKLDEDRKKKNCEFAVLVSMLEMDSDLYNEGIVVVPGYEKMYVVRPEYFIPIITLLVQTSRKALDFKKQLAVAKAQSVDVTDFEDKMNEFKDKFSSHAKFARDRFDDAIRDIDATIKKLQAVRESLTKSDNYVRLASDDVNDLSIRKLTWKNPTMKAKFAEARASKGLDPEIPDEQ